MNGSKIFVNPGLPNIDLGKNSDLYIDKSTGNYYQKKNNIWQLENNLVGTSGNDGKPGSKITFGIGIPSKIIGNDNDVYIDKKSGSCYTLICGKWIYQFNLIGPKGDNGNSGSKGDKGDNGLPGQPGSLIYTGVTTPSDNLGKNGDMYLNTTNGVYYIKNNDVWTYEGSLIGPQGPKGDKGEIRMTYTLINSEIIPLTIFPDFSTIAYFPWYFDRYSMFSIGILIFYAVIEAAHLIVRVIDSDGNIIGGPLTITKTGISIIDLTEPIGDTNLSIQICKNTDSSEGPILYSVNLELDK